MEPKRSGHCDRYRLRVSYLLEHRQVSVDELLGGRPDAANVEAERRAAPLSGNE
jgi:hypothetical protein